MYDEQIEGLISAALADGVLTEKEKQILFKKAQSMGIDLDEFEMVLDARLVEIQKAEKEKAEKSAPKSDKYGTVRKCPACGAIVPAFQGVCPECGHEFMDVDANASSKKLAEQLLKENNTNKQKQIIETFPLPNTKADLLEFLTALKPRINDTKDPLSKSYFKKYQECIEKAKVSFPNDKLIAPFIAEHDAILKKYKKEESVATAISWIKDNTIKIAIFLCLILLFGWIGTCSVKSAVKKHNERKYNAELEQLISSSVSTNDEIINLLMQKDGEWGTNELLQSMVDAKKIEAAKFLFHNKMDIHGEDSHPNEYRWLPNEFETKAMSIMYKYMIDNEEMNEAWMYHKVGWPSDNFHVASDYYEYMNDVVTAYCKNHKADLAKEFVDSHIGWFKIYIDNDNEAQKIGWTKEYTSTAVLRKLNSIINNLK